MQPPKYRDCQILSGHEQDKTELQNAINRLLEQGYDLINFSTVANNVTGYHGTCLYTAIMAQPITTEEHAVSHTSLNVVEEVQEPDESEVFSINGTDDRPVKFTEPVAFVFDGNRVKVDKWNHLVIQLCELIQTKNNDLFHRVLDHFGARRFSRDFPPEVAATTISGTDIFINTVFSAEQAKSTAVKLITLFGYDKNALVIEIRDKPEKAE